MAPHERFHVTNHGFPTREAAEAYADKVRAAQPHISTRVVDTLGGRQ